MKKNEEDEKLEGFRAINVDLPVSLYERIRAYCTAHDMTMSEVVRLALDREVRR